MGNGLWAEVLLGFSSLSSGFSCEIKTCKVCGRTVRESESEVLGVTVQCEIKCRVTFQDGWRREYVPCDSNFLASSFCIIWTVRFH
jgi:hypothetical protein